MLEANTLRDGDFTMIERSAISEQPAVPDRDTAGLRPENGYPALEQRVRRLEDAVAALQDTCPLEERIAERVSRRLKRRSPDGLQDSGGVLNAGRQLLPAAVELVRTKAAGAEGSGGWARSWLLFDVYAELQTIVRMFLDRRYQPTWPARVIPLAVLLLILTSWVWLPVPSILGTTILSLLDKLVDLALAFGAFKILSREARRYRELVTDLPSNHS
jgi:hypothetical protein